MPVEDLEMFDEVWEKEKRRKTQEGKNEKEKADITGRRPSMRSCILTLPRL